MEIQIKHLKISLKIEVVYGIVLSCFVGLILGVMSTDAPSSTPSDFMLGGSIGFLILFFPTVLLPILAIKELDKFPENQKIVLNIINAVVVLLIIFFPLSIWKLYMLYKLKVDRTMVRKDQSDH